MKPLGARINEQLAEIQEHTRELRSLVRSVMCDSELPPGSKLSESHLDDLVEAKGLLSQAAVLVGNLTQEALDELEGAV